MRRLLINTLIGFTVLLVSLRDVEVNADVPSETECRPYIEKAINELQSHDHSDGDRNQVLNSPDTGPESADSDENNVEQNLTETIDADVIVDQLIIDSDDELSNENLSTNVDNEDDSPVDETENEVEEKSENDEESSEANADENVDESNEQDVATESDTSADEDVKSEENADEQKDDVESDRKDGEQTESIEQSDNTEGDQIIIDNSTEEEDVEIVADDENDTETDSNEEKLIPELENDEVESAEQEIVLETENHSAEEVQEDQEDNSTEEIQVEEVIEKKIVEDVTAEAAGSEVVLEEATESADESVEEAEIVSEHKGDTSEETGDASEEAAVTDNSNEEVDKSDEPIDVEQQPEDSKENEVVKSASEEDVDKIEPKVEESIEQIKVKTVEKESAQVNETESINESVEESNEVAAADTIQSYPEDDLLLEFEIPTNLRDRSHIAELLHLDDESAEREKAVDKASEVILKDLKRIYENAIKPLETLYKYRDLSNRHFSDPEIFSKPLVLFMGPWSGGKSSILNYLSDNEYTQHSLRTGAEPSPAYFNILMHGDKPEVLDGTQLAADWTFSGLQKFGEGLEDRLRGLKLPNKLLEKVNIVEIPGILEVRKQVSRLFPFNDACQWFIDRADIIFLVYDPSKLDVGPETEAILDQLKGREYQTRILLNKGDQVKPEELLRVQSALIWNISPLMSSAQPPVMYTTSLWSNPYETGAPIRLLQAQERAFLRDLRAAVDKRIENKIASARRFAVRVRNHAKMVDCYLTTYYNHKTLFGNKKQIADKIIEHPQNYHIYEGLSTLTNISRYDLPDPDVYRGFFRLNNLYDFKKLSETCTYFRGCPINKLDIAISYDLPELVGKYKKLSEAALQAIESKGTGKS